MGPVPTWRRGRPGTHRHRVQIPMDVARGSATAPATSAQYPHPIQARETDTATETAWARMLLAETSENRMARMRRARCWTERQVKKIVTATALATATTRGSPYKRARRGPAAANPIVRRRPRPPLIQNRLLTRA